MNVVIIDYGAGNVKSVQFALSRIGIEALCTNSVEDIKYADKVIFPGVGHAASAMLSIKKHGLDALIPDLKQDVLGICLGMQLMCKATEEGNMSGLNIFPTQVVRFDVNEKIPHMGWNTLVNTKGDLFKELPLEAYVYNVHSFYVPINEYTVATTNYGINYSSALQKDNFYACQFHPEKSGLIGEQILKNFIDK